MSTATLSISSIGQICQLMQRPYGAVRRAIEAMQLQPALVINGVAHFDDSAVEKIGKFLKGERNANGR